MLSATSPDYLEFAPPKPSGLAGAFLVACLIHLLLLAALTWGIHWNRSDQSVAVEAELWSNLPQLAPPPPAAEPEPEPVPEAKPVVEPPKPEPAVKPRAEAARKEHEAELAIEKKERLKLAELEKAKAEKLKKEKDKEKDKERLRKEQEEEKRLNAQRNQNIEKMRRMANMTRESSPASSNPNTGMAAKSSGPSAGYAAKIRKLVKDNLRLLDAVAGNPEAEVLVQCSPLGERLNFKLSKSSGVKAWDEAVLNAIDRIQKLPEDADGRVPCPMIIVSHPLDP